MVTQRLPWPPDRGGEITESNFLRELHRRGHAVDIVSTDWREDADRHAQTLRQWAESVTWTPRNPARSPEFVLNYLRGRSMMRSRYATKRLRALVLEHLAARRYDVILVEGFHVEPVPPPPDAPPVALDLHNVHWLFWERFASSKRHPLKKLFGLEEARRVRREEPAAWRRVDLAIAVSDDEAATVRRAAPETHAVVVTPGAEVMPEPPSAARSGPPTIVFTGTMSYFPNADGAEWLVREVMPHVWAECPEARLQIVGARPGPGVQALAGPRVEVTGYVDSVAPYLEGGSCLVVPLRFGAGIRMKVLEAWGAGLPVVSTTLGAEGLPARNGDNALIEDDPARFASAVVSLLRDPSRGLALSQAGWRVAHEGYSWQAVGERLERALVETAERKQ